MLKRHLHEKIRLASISKKITNLEYENICKFLNILVTNKNIKNWGFDILINKNSIKNQILIELNFLELFNNDNRREYILNILSTTYIKSTQTTRLLGPQSSPKSGSLGLSKIKFSNINTPIFARVYGAKRGGRHISDTDEKEALTIKMYRANLGIDSFSNSSISKYKEKLVKTDTTYELGESTEKKINEFIFLSSQNKTTMRYWNESLSIANKLQETYKSQEFFLIRNDLYNNIRKLFMDIQKSTKNKKISILVDKWNPGDAYLINKQQVHNIELNINKLILENKTKVISIDLLNNLFSSSYGNTNKLTSISLKGELAQGGKAKGILKKYKTKDMDFNITETEYNYNYTQYVNKIKQMDSQFIQLLRHVYLPININFFTQIKKSNNYINKIRTKFTNMKILMFIVRAAEKENVNIYKILMSVFRFGLSMTKISSHFFKLSGDSKYGQAKVLNFNNHNSITYDNINTLKIDNSSTLASHIRISADLNFNTEIKPIKMQIRSNGNIQSTIEIQSF